jgi:hypothetical protein
MSLKNHHIEDLLLEIEKQNEKSFSYRHYIMNIIEVSRLNKMCDTFNRLIFLAKFLHNTNNIMNRIGKNGEGYVKLLTEFMNHTNEVINILKKIVEVAPEDIRNELKNYMHPNGFRF